MNVKNKIPKPNLRKLFTVSVLALLLVSLFGGVGVWQIKPALSGVSDHPSGRLHIGNETLGENPCFFYDENGHLTTLRTLQDGTMDIAYYTDTIYSTSQYYPDGWANSTIKFAKDAEFNTLRIHIFFGEDSKTSNDWLFPTRGVANATVFSYFLDFLQDLADNDLYYVLDGYWHEGDAAYWMTQELRGAGGLLWNDTVINDFIWCWNETLARIEAKGSDVLDHLVFIEPWSEWILGGTATSYIGKSRNPYLYNGTGSLGDASLVSWHNWLNTYYGGDIALLKTHWAYGSGEVEPWNYTGTETDSFDSLVMALKTRTTSMFRGVDFATWYADTIQNFTQTCNDYWKSKFPDLYVAWDGFASAFGAGASITETDNRARVGCVFNTSDVIDAHDFSEQVTPVDWTYYGGDRWVYQQIQMAAMARALKKPFVTFEFGVSSGTTGYLTANDIHNYAIWNITLSKALRYGYAGWCPYWISYWHGYESGSSSRITRCDARQPYMKTLNLMFEAAENWLDKIVYDPIMVTCNVGESYLAEKDTGGSYVMRLFDQAGYTPKYVRYIYDNDTIFPNTIPSDVEILVLTDLICQNRYSKGELKQANDWLNADSAHKIVLSTDCYADFYEESLYYENQLNVTKFPLSTVARGTSYTKISNTTNCHVDVDGVSVLINRTAYEAQYENFTYSYITAGTCLINYTDGEYADQPMTLINSQVCWIGSPLAKTVSGTPSEIYTTHTNGFLIIQKILSHWNYQPRATGTATYNRVGYGYVNMTSTWGQFNIWSFNVTASGTLNTTFNLTRMGLDDGYNYAMFFESNKTVMQKTPAELETAMTILIDNLTARTITLRKNDTPCFLYGTGYLSSETFASGNLTLQISGTPNHNSTTYVWWNSTIEPTVSCNATLYNSAWDATNQLLTLTANHTSTVEWVLETWSPPEVTVVITYPENTTYTIPTVSVQVSASGGTIDTVLWNCTFTNGTVVYANTVYTVATSMTLGNGSYIFNAWANNTDGDWDEATVMFTVAISADTYTLTLTVTNPQNTTYTSSSIPVQLGTSGNDTNPVITWNAQFSNGTWVYGTNQTYSMITIMVINENATNIRFCGYAIGDNLAVDYKEVMFTVEITTTPPSPPEAPPVTPPLPVPPVTVTWILYMRSDTHTVDNQLGYVLWTSQTFTYTYIGITKAAPNETSYWGWRFWIVYKDNSTQELTGGYVANVSRTVDGSGLQSATYTPDKTNFGLMHMTVALKADLYMWFGSDAPTLEATFISNNFLSRAILNSTWTVYTYTFREANATYQTSRFYWGTATYNSRIASFSYHQPYSWEAMYESLGNKDLVGFFLVPGLYYFGALFYGVGFALGGFMLYMRYKSFAPLLVLLILLGGVGGALLKPLIPTVGFEWGWVLVMLGVAGLFYKLVHGASHG